MDGSCLEELPNEKSPPPVPEPLHRMGSGACSVVLDPTPESGVETESRKLPSSQYKGVVPQPNGRWGAQIYEKHQRVWLGTFPDEAEAARAYDVAAQRFRGRDAVTNFTPLSEKDEDGAAELAFLAAHSKAEIVDMLRKHTYRDELRQSKRAEKHFPLNIGSVEVFLNMKAMRESLEQSQAKLKARFGRSVEGKDLNMKVFRHGEKMKSFGARSATKGTEQVLSYSFLINLLMLTFNLGIILGLHNEVEEFIL